jgi:hypothetical protein
MEISVTRALLLNHQSHKIESDIFVVFKFGELEILKTNAVSHLKQVVWNETFIKTQAELLALEKHGNKPFMREYFQVEIWQKSGKVYETRIPLADTGKNLQSYKLLRPEGTESKKDTAHESSY